MQNVSLADSWKGFLSFSFEFITNRTVVKDKQHFGPLVVQRPYYQELDCPMVLVIHPPGGIAGGDELLIEIACKPESKGMVSTPAATKFYRSDNKLAKQCQRISMVGKCELEWLPQETLFFDQSCAENSLSFNLESTESKLIAWDIIGLGRPARNEGFQGGRLTQTLTVNVAGKLRLKDRTVVNSESMGTRNLPGLNNNTLFATMIVYGSLDDLQKVLAELRTQDWFSQAGLGVTLVHGLLVVRLVSCELETIKQVLFDVWTLARPIVLKKNVVKPRIWNT